MAALVPTGPRTDTIVVLGPSEIRVAFPSARPSVLRHLLLRERPDLVVAAGRPPWLRMLGLRVVSPEPTLPIVRIGEVPELRPFLGTAEEEGVARAFALAVAALTRYRHADAFPED